MLLGASLKMARVLFDKLQEMKDKYSHFEWHFQKNAEAL